MQVTAFEAGPDGARPSAVATLAAIAIATVALILAGLLSTAVLHWVQRTNGVVSPHRQESAWINDPQSADLGVGPKAGILFFVVPKSAAPLSWSASNRGRVINHGSFAGLPGTAQEIFASTSAASAKSWVTIQIAGLPTPLRVWIK